MTGFVVQGHKPVWYGMRSIKKELNIDLAIMNDFKL